MLILVLILVACARAAEGLTVESAPSQSSAPSPPAPATPTPGLSLPTADAPGEDLARLPRFPEAVRTDYVVTRDQLLRSMASSYLSAATVDEVRTYYQRVILEHGWQRADIDYDGGSWTYVLVDGAVEALIRLRPTEGFVTIDLRVSEPLAPVIAPTPEPDQGGEGGGDGGGNDDDDDD